MIRTYRTYAVNDIKDIKQQMLSWVHRFNICCFFDNNNYPSQYSSYECLAGAGVLKAFEATDDFFDSLSSFVEQNNDWMFGHFSYEIKNLIEPTLSSSNPDYVLFPEYNLFIPKVVLQLKDNQLTIGALDSNQDQIFEEIINEQLLPVVSSSLHFTSRISKEEYIQAVTALKKHIHLGDCYVINYCQEFYANGTIEPLNVYQQLNQVSPNPFSAYYRVNHTHLFCASPERFIKKANEKIISQPIKGTAPRDKDVSTDEQIKYDLYNNEKERSENVMVVDLVRNDLSKVCKEASVDVEELFGIYSYPNVHQMISTVTGLLAGDKDFADVLKATFPMGSMTGAPKKRVMELIEEYEQSTRGIYSGTVGYISPQKDFDFNVVIRSLAYNAETNYLSYHVGSAITAYCNEEKEYEECLLKGQAIASLFCQD